MDVNASEINEEMKEAASEAIRDFVEPSKDKVVPETPDKELAMEIADQVKEAARITGVNGK